MRRMQDLQERQKGQAGQVQAESKWDGLSWRDVSGWTVHRCDGTAPAADLCGDVSQHVRVLLLSRRGLHAVWRLSHFELQLSLFLRQRLYRDRIALLPLTPCEPHHGDGQDLLRRDPNPRRVLCGDPEWLRLMRGAAVRPHSCRLAS